MLKLPQLALLLLVVIALSALASFAFDLESFSQPPSEKSPPPTTSFSPPPPTPSQSPQDQALQIAIDYLAGKPNLAHESINPPDDPKFPLTKPYDRYEYSYLQDAYDYDPQENLYLLRVGPLPPEVKARVQIRDAQIIDLYYDQNTNQRFQVTIHIDPLNNKVISWSWFYGNQ